MKDAIQIGLLGCGVVGGGVVEVLTNYGERLEEIFGRPVEIAKIAVRDMDRPRQVHVPRQKLCNDWHAVCTSPEVDTVIEVMGGKTAAGKAIEVALRHGKHVVTANKELLASGHGATLYELAAEKGVRLECEASVLGGIPALHTLESYFRVNRISCLRGIVNGTSNYILTQMHESGVEFEEALTEAQRLGYAEPDPTLDIEGYDAWFKLKILVKYVSQTASATAFDTSSPIGISALTQADIKGAEVAGKKIKHIVHAQWNEAGKLQKIQVGPAVLAPTDPLFHVDGVQNALSVTGDIVGDILITGPGAGALPTASAILEDLAKVYHVSRGNARENKQIAL